jgi:hypothetical protein
MRSEVGDDIEVRVRVITKFSRPDEHYDTDSGAYEGHDEDVPELDVYHASRISVGPSSR